MKKYTAVIFDLDGTLLDTLDDLTDAVNYALLQNGFPSQTRDDVCAVLGNGIVRLFEAFIPQGQTNIHFGDCLNDFRIIYPQISQNHTRPYTGIPELLDLLQNKGILTAVVSNKFHTAAKELVAHYFPTISFCMGEQEAAGIRRKPAPDMIFQILREHNIPADQCLYVGDSEVDIETAKNAGIDDVSVTWGLRDSSFLKEHGAKCLIHTPPALIEYILLHIS